MTYVAYPSNIPTPEKPFSGELMLPLSATDAGEIGAYISRRDRTRANIKGGATLRLNSAQMALFITFQRITLNKGLKLFTAQWITDLGYIGYVAKIPSFSVSLNGSMPVVSLDIELIPDVRYSVVAPTIPSPWPAEVYG